MSSEDSWRQHAACLGMDQSLWYPERSEFRKIREAKRICSTCPVQRQCLEQAIERGERHGIWAGRSAARGLRRVEWIER